MGWDTIRAAAVAKVSLVSARVFIAQVRPVRLLMIPTVHSLPPSRESIRSTSELPMRTVSPSS